MIRSARSSERRASSADTGLVDFKTGRLQLQLDYAAELLFVLDYQTRCFMALQKEKGAESAPFAALIWIDPRVVTSWSPSNRGVFSIARCLLVPPRLGMALRNGTRSCDSFRSETWKGSTPSVSP